MLLRVIHKTFAELGTVLETFDFFHEFFKGKIFVLQNLQYTFDRLATTVSTNFLLNIVRGIIVTVYDVSPFPGFDDCSC